MPRRPLSCLDNHGVLPRRPLQPSPGLGYSRVVSWPRALSVPPAAVHFHHCWHRAQLPRPAPGEVPLSTAAGSSGGALGGWKRGCWVRECHEGGQQTARRCHYCCARREPFRFLPTSLSLPHHPRSRVSRQAPLVCMWLFAYFSVSIFVSTQLSVYVHS